MTKTYRTQSSKLRLLLIKALETSSFHRFASFCFLLIFFCEKTKVKYKT